MSLKKFIIILIALVVLMTGYIFSNSLKNREDSSTSSEGIVKIIKPIVDPQDKIPEDVFHNIIRKLAHMTEFGALGILVALLSDLLRRYFGRKFISFPFFYCLLAAVLDECFQSFSDRSPEVRDVLIDFSGATLGILFVTVIIFVLIKTKKIKE